MGERNGEKLPNALNNHRRRVKHRATLKREKEAKTKFSPAQKSLAAPSWAVDIEVKNKILPPKFSVEFAGSKRSKGSALV